MNRLTSFTDSRLAYVAESRHTVRQLARWFSPTVLEIPVLFDDDDARETGANLCDRLLVQLGPRYAMHQLPWKLTVTRFPQLAEIVVREAMRSPFLLVTINGANAVTPEVETLIRRCVAELHGGRGALVVQLHGIAKAQKESSPVYQCLSRIAEEAKIPIFSKVVDLNHQSRGAGRASPNRSGSPFVATPPQTLPKDS
jgi:hypothetical protein